MPNTTNRHLRPTTTRDVEKQLQPPALLRLPPGLRHRIYLYAGVAHPVPGYAFTHYLDSRTEPPRIVPAFDAAPPRHFTGLLRSCRALYAEVAALLYSANRFVIFYSDQGSLEPLRNLSATALVSLASLKIVLNESSCHQATGLLSYPPPCCCDDPHDEPRTTSRSYYCAKNHGNAHRRPLLSSVSTGLASASTESAVHAMLTEWHDTAAYMSSRITARALVLSLVCDIDHRHQYALEAGRLAVAPLALFPPLRDCHVRLGKEWNRPLQRHAENAVLQARQDSSPFCATPVRGLSTLTDLPRELRLHILGYTDLITPWNEVTWCREYRRFQVCRPPCLSSEGGCLPHIHHGCRLSQCNIGRHDTSIIPLSPGCFCRRRHAAFSFTCNCWAPPTNLFLVCRVFCRDAQFVFFSENRFVVHDFHATPCSALPPIQYEPETPDATAAGKSYPYDRFNASHFLRNIVPAHCLADLRFLELVFPPYVPQGWPPGEHPAMLDWRATVAWLHGRVNARVFTVRFVFPDFLYGHPDELATRRELSWEQGMSIVQGYKRIIYPFQPLLRNDSLAALYVQAAYPWRWTRHAIRWMQQPRQDHWLAEKERDLKEHCENLPGCEEIVVSRNRAEPRKSVWQRWYDVKRY